MKKIKQSIFISIIVSFFFLSHLQGQLKKYTMEDVHSHNDYKQKRPFYNAYEHGVGSIEADIYLRNDSLIVSHLESEMEQNNLLEKMYLDPIQEKIVQNQGSPFKNKNLHLNLLIDLKSDGAATLDALVRHLEKYEYLIHCPTIKIIIAGNQPPDSLWVKYPNYIYFDGNVNVDYNTMSLSKIGMFSANFADYMTWDNNGGLIVSRADIQAVVKRIHQLKKKIRFWGIPDNITTWKNVESLNIDYLNTDHIEQMYSFIQNGN